MRNGWHGWHGCGVNVIAVQANRVITEFGEARRRDLPTILRATHGPALVACTNAGKLLWELDQELDWDPRWQFRVSMVPRQKWSAARAANIALSKTQVSYFGFRRLSGHKRGSWFYPISPLDFCAMRPDAILTDTSIESLYAWAVDVRDWCLENDLTPRPTAAGLSAQLLRDKRFWPGRRGTRKVPARHNERARQALPGNFYHLEIPSSTIVTRADYWDQESAHHTIAETIDLPNGENFYAIGHWREAQAKTPGHFVDRRYCDIDQIKGHGLLLVRLHAMGAPGPAPDYLRDPGSKLAYITTNEVDLIEELGGRIEYVIAGWLSRHADAGIKRYATWAKEQRAKASPERARWLKPTLLSLYGLLATGKRPQRIGMKHTSGNVKAHYPVGGKELLEVSEIRLPAREPHFAHVTQRVMIEAETRKRSIIFARANANRLVSIYADGVILRPEPAGQMELAKPGPGGPGWRMSGHLSALRFYAPHSFSALECSKLPGVSKGRRELVANQK